MRKFHLIYAVILILALAACAGADIKNTSSDSAPGRTAPDFALPDQDGKLWKLSDADIHFEAHVDVDDMPVSGTERIQKRIEENLRDRFGVTHTTLQFECDKCKTKRFI